MLQTTSIGELVRCPAGDGTLFLLAMGFAWVRLSDGTEWSGLQSEVIQLKV